MSGPDDLQSVSQSAADAGLASDQSAAATTTACPYASQNSTPADPRDNVCKPYEYCDIQQLIIKMSAPGKSATFMVDHPRTAESPSPAHGKDYQAELRTHDIIIEALSDIRNETSTDGGAAEAGKDANPLQIEASAVNSAAHSGSLPPHPWVTVATAAGSQRSEGGAPVKASYLIAPVLHGFGLAKLWPFGRAEQHTIDAASCGIVPVGQTPNTRLAASLHVVPYDEWTISFGISASKSSSYKVERDFRKPQDGDSGRRVVSTTVVKKLDGGIETSTTTENMKTAKMGLERTRVTEGTKIINYSVLGQDSQTIKDIKEDWQKVGRTDDPKPEHEGRKVKIKRKIAGQEVEVKANEIIDGFFKAKELVDKIKKVFDKIKFGASFSIGYDMFGGDFNIVAGNRWPSSYKEEDRVYYVERYVKIGGKCEVFKATVTGFFGLSFESPVPFIDAAVELGGYLDVSLNLPVEASIEHSWTKASKDFTMPITVSPKFSLEPGLKANGHAAGYSVSGKVAIEAEISFTAKGEVATNHPLYVKASLLIGKESDDSTDAAPDYDAVRLVAEFIFQGASVRKWQIKPIGLIKGQQVFKDYYLLGEKPGS